MGERRRYRRVLTTGLIVLTAVVTPLGEGGPPGVRAGQWPGCITPFLDNAVPLAVVADEGRGRVFVADWRSNRVWVVAAADGAIIRSTGAGPNPGAVAIDRRVGRVFVLNTPFDIPGGGRPRSTVGVLDAATGALLRTTTVGRMDGLSMAGSLAVDEATGRAFVLNSGDHSVSVLATADGRLLGTVALPGAPSAVAVDARRHRVFVATTRGDTQAGAVAVLDSATGRVLGTVTVGLAPTQVAVDSRIGRVFVGVGGGSYGPVPAGTPARERAGVQAFDTAGAPWSAVPAAGRPSRWRPVVAAVPFGLGPPNALAVDEASGRAFSTAWSDHDGSVLVVLDAAGLPVTRRSAASLTLHRRRLSATDNLGLLVDPVTGRVFTHAWAPTSRVFGAGPHLDEAIFGVTGALGLLNPRTGASVARIPTGFLPGALTTGERDGRVFTLTGRTRLESRDGRTGALLWSAVLGLLPVTLAVDETTGRLAVATFNDGRVRLLDPTARWVEHTTVVGYQPVALAITSAPGGPAVLVANFGGYVSTVQESSGRVVRVDQIEPKALPMALATDQLGGGHVYVANCGSRTVSILDGRRGTPERTVPVIRYDPTGLSPSPWTVAVDTRRSLLFVVSEWSSTLSVLDSHSGALIDQLPAWGGVVAVDTRAGRVAYSQAQGDYPCANAVGFLETRLPGRTQRSTPTRSVPTGSCPIALAMDTRAGLTFASLERTPTWSGTQRPVVVLDTRRGTLLRRLSVPTGLARTDLGQGLLTTDAGTGRLIVVEGEPGRVNLVP